MRSVLYWQANVAVRQEAVPPIAANEEPAAVADAADTE